MDILTGAIAQVLFLLALLSFGIFSWKGRSSTMPFVLSPGCLLVVSTTVGSLSAYVLDASDFSEYMIMWKLQVTGMLGGLIVTHFLGYADGRSQLLVFNRRRLIFLSATLFGLGVVSAFAFFALQGVPALKANLEQARVDAAAEGTGYFRLLAYMTIPAALTLFSIRARGGVIAIICALLVLIALANRSPLLYLCVPLVFVAVAGSIRSIGSGRILLAAIILATLIVGGGVYRIFSQSEFRQYDEYKNDLNEGNIIGVAKTSLFHYAEVVAHNAVLSKHLVDSGRLNLEYGSSYFTLFLTALPGEQLSLDRKIKLASDKDFIGGGTPPTLMGEGYINFSYPGVLLSGFMAAALVNFWFIRMAKVHDLSEPEAVRFAALMYGFAGCWTTLAQVSGFAGASTISTAMYCIYLLFWVSTTRRFYPIVTAP